MENKDSQSESISCIFLPVEREPDTVAMAIHYEAVDEPVRDTTIKLEQASPEETYAGCSGTTCSRIQVSQIMDVKHEVGIPEPVWSKTELKWKGSIEVPWQVYKHGKLIRHIWDIGSWHPSSLGTINVEPDTDSGLAVEQPVKHPASVGMIICEQTMGKTDVSSGINASPTVEQVVKTVTSVEAPVSEPGQLFYCERCVFSCKNQHLLEDHVRNHMMKERHRCSVCKYSSTRKSHLTRHMRTHTGEKPFECTLCEYKSMYMSHLIVHKKIHTGEKAFRCTVCEYRCTERRHLLRHIRTHTGEKPFKCTLCEYSAARQCNLANHMKIHTGEKPFKCTFCEYRCTANGNLVKHLRTHTGEKPFKCSFCEYRCTERCNLTKHIRTHTGEKPFKCTVCEYRCTTQSNLIGHMRTHTGDKPFKCTLCEYRCDNECADISRPRIMLNSHE